MHKIIFSLAAGTLLAAASIGAFAQAASAPQTPRVDLRQERQDRRIEQGTASGQLTPREARRLNREQAGVARAEQHAKADGRVTRHERRRLHHLQNHASRDIRRQRHDAQTAQ